MASPFSLHHGYKIGTDVPRVFTYTRSVMADAEHLTPRAEHLARLLDLWGQLQHARDPKERRSLERRIREESDAYKRMTEHVKPYES
jgi:hypothetical protein